MNFTAGGHIPCGSFFIFASMKCRPGCGACCIVISISSPIKGMPQGKPAGVRCIHLTDECMCSIFNDPQRPGVCNDFKAEKLICGDSREEAIGILSELEGINN